MGALWPRIRQADGAAYWLNSSAIWSDYGSDAPSTDWLSKACESLAQNASAHADHQTTLRRRRTLLVGQLLLISAAVVVLLAALVEIPR